MLVVYPEITTKKMTNFWEDAFKAKQEMWGFEPARSAVLTADLFVQNNIKSVLIPGIGYGRNAQIFRAKGMSVTGIEISQTAIDLAHKNVGTDLQIYRGSVTEMPFDNQVYQGIFCYGLIYLLDQAERTKLIQDCYNQLMQNGLMVFTVITKNASTYGQGTPIGKDRFEQFGGAKLFFYDRETIAEAFGDYGLFEVAEVEENYPFYVIVCRK